MKNTTLVIIILYIVQLLCLIPFTYSINDAEYIKRGCDTNIRLKDLDNVDFIIGGVFPSTYYFPKTDSYDTNYAAVTWVSAMLYAMSEINKNTTILPGIRLGYDIYDSCDSVELGARYALNFMVNKNYYKDGNTKLIGVVGGALSDISALLNSVISSEYTPQISYSSTSEALSESWRYRSFLRTVPSDKHLAAAIIDLIRYFKWTYVSAFAIDDAYGRVGLEELQISAKTAGVCLEHALTFNEKLKERELSEIVGHLKELTLNTTHIVILWAPYKISEKIMGAARAANISKWSLVFIGPHIWTDTMHERENFYYRTIVTKLKQPLLNDSFIKDMQYSFDINWDNPWIRKIFERSMLCPEKVLKSKDKPPTCMFRLPERMASAVISGTRSKYPQVIAAVYAIALGLHEYLGCTKTTCPKWDPEIDFKKLFEIIKKCDFILPPGSEGYHISFDQKTGEIVNKEYIFNMHYQTADKAVGTWFGPNNIDASPNAREASFWYEGGIPSGQCSQDCKPGSYKSVDSSSSCCWTCPSCGADTISSTINQEKCVPCEASYEVASSNQTYCIKLREIRIKLDNYIGLLLIASCIVGVLIVLFVILVFVRHWNTPVVKSSSREISIIQLLSLMLLFCLPLLYFFPLSPLFCLFRTLIFGFLFTTVVAIILVKTYRLIRVFSNRFTKVSRFLHTNYQILFIYVLVVFELIAVLLWNWNFQPAVETDIYKSKLIYYLKCDYYQTVIFWIVMLYIFILVIVSGYYAFRARKLPENYNEAQYISLTMFTVIVVWVAYVPLFFSLDPYSNSIAFLFQNFICTLAVTFIMYAYKVYIILFNPKLNSPEHARQQHKDHFLDSLHRDQWKRGQTPPEQEPFRPRLASLPSLPVAVHQPSVFDDPDGGEPGSRRGTLHKGERQRLIDRLQPRRASFSSMSQLEKINHHKSYETFNPGLDVLRREIRKSQSTSFLLDASLSVEMQQQPPRSATSHNVLSHFSGLKKVFSNVSIHKLLDHHTHHHHHHEKVTEKTSLLSSSGELNTKL
ncbi:metabotropic glutamate receptor 3-like [Clytia hemisphaerica]|uniref:G-protein coupled receptors family 3 profile domain-containing protein n=1 Tax=Clytia hemisphaerica TaxID=252671 RepID=A0A7M5X4Y3_9CNID